MTPIKAFVLEHDSKKDLWEIWDGQFGECVGVAPSYEDAVKMLVIRAGSVAS